MVLSITAPILPNIRKLIIPDPGMLIADCDLSGADAQVVAWEAGDEDLKAAFRAGLKIHVKNATDMLGEEFTKLEIGSAAYNAIYASMKAFVHGVNYGERERTLAITQGWPIAKATSYRRRWLDRHPAISVWHRRIMHGLETTRMVRNAFGFRITYFDRIESCFTQALAWGPQSTVALTCTRGLLQVRDRLPWVQPLIQVHDSGVFQFPKHRLKDILQLRDALSNPVPYSDPLTIPWGLAISNKSWGDVIKMKWEEAVDFKF